MRDQIDEWREKYCFTTTNGQDVACQETIIDLSYVKEALAEWRNGQYDLYLQDKVEERNSDRLRMATIAFHCAIVLHMLAGNPQPNDRKLRKTVKALTIYIANYCMERYIAKFSNARIPQAQVQTEDIDTPASDTVHRSLTEEEILEWYPRRGSYDEEGNVIGYGMIAKRLGVDKDSVRNSFIRYEKGFKPK